MMDADTPIHVSENGAGYENGVHDQLPTSEERVVIEKDNGVPSYSSDVEGLVAHFGEVTKLNESESSGFSAPELTGGSMTLAEGDEIESSKEVESKESADLKNEKQQKVRGKTNNGKLPGSKNASGTLAKKSKDEKDMLTTFGISNGTTSMGIKSKSKPLNDGNSKPVIAATNTKHAKQQTGDADSAQHESHVDETKLKALKKSTSNKSDEVSDSSSPTSGDAKARRTGALPAYNFSFKCDERAEKRREFYSKLEEKIHAKEVEKSTMQAKSKETQEAELKMLRKKLKFKATPMPSFYQEPAPPKSELKKIPTTRAKSPKLGRKKSSPTRVSGEESEIRTRPSRLSLDEKVPLNTPAKASPIVNVKKPVRKSLPKLPSEKTNLSNEKKMGSSRRTSLSKGTNESELPQENPSEELSGAAADNVHEEESAPEVEPAQKIQVGTDDEPIIEGQEATTSVNQTIEVAQ